MAHIRKLVDIQQRQKKLINLQLVKNLFYGGTRRSYMENGWFTSIGRRTC